MLDFGLGLIIGLCLGTVIGSIIHRFYITIFSITEVTQTQTQTQNYYGGEKQSEIQEEVIEKKEELLDKEQNTTP